MAIKKKPGVNRRKHDIAQEKHTKSNQRKTVLIVLLKTLAYVLLAVLVYPYIKDSSLFKNNNKTKKPVEITAYQEPEIEYNFYSLLPGEKVIEPPAKFSYTRQDDLSKVESYMLQVGSFKNARRAENLKKILSKHKFKKIILDKVENKKAIWYRVSLGPFADIKSAQEARVKLTLKGIYNSVIKTWNIK